MKHGRTLLITILIVVCVAAGLFAIPQSVIAADPPEEVVTLTGNTDVAWVQKQIAAKMALLPTGGVLRVTGAKLNMLETLYLNIPAGKKVLWEAQYGLDSVTHLQTLISLTGMGEFELAEGGYLYCSSTTGYLSKNARSAGLPNFGGRAATMLLSEYGVDITVSGGVIEAPAFFESNYKDEKDWKSSAIVTHNNVTVTGGHIYGGDYAIKSVGKNAKINVSGGTIDSKYDNFRCSRASLYVKNTVENGYNGFKIEGFNVVAWTHVQSGSAIYATGDNAEITINGGKLTGLRNAIWVTGKQAKVAIKNGEVGTERPFYADTKWFERSIDDFVSAYGCANAIEASGESATVAVTGGRVYSGRADFRFRPISWSPFDRIYRLNPFWEDSMGKTDQYVIAHTDPDYHLGGASAIMCSGKSAKVTVDGGLVENWTRSDLEVLTPTIYMSNKAPANPSTPNIEVRSTSKVFGHGPNATALYSAAAILVADNAEVATDFETGEFTVSMREQDAGSPTVASLWYSDHAGETVPEYSHRYDPARNGMNRTIWAAGTSGGLGTTPVTIRDNANVWTRTGNAVFGSGELFLLNNAQVRLRDVYHYMPHNEFDMGYSAIKFSGAVHVRDNTQVYAPLMYGSAIAGATYVEISGGLVYSCGSGILDVIDCPHIIGTDSLQITGGAVIVWDKLNWMPNWYNAILGAYDYRQYDESTPAYVTPVPFFQTTRVTIYEKGTDTDLKWWPANAYVCWYRDMSLMPNNTVKGGNPGIFYQSGTQSGIIRHERLVGDLLVPRSWIQPNQVSANVPAEYTFDGTGQGISMAHVTIKAPDINTTTAGELWLEYRGARGTAYPPSKSKPILPGRYEVALRAAGGTEYIETNLLLGTYVINGVSTATIDITGTSESMDALQTRMDTALGSLAPGGGLTVTGTKNGGTKTLILNIPEGKTVFWKAQISGQGGFRVALVEVRGYGTFEVCANGSIESADGYAVYVHPQYEALYVGDTKAFMDNNCVLGPGNYIKTLSIVVSENGKLISGVGASSFEDRSETSALSTPGRVTVKDNALISAEHGNAIYSSGWFPQIYVQGGTVTSASAIGTIWTIGPRATVEVSGTGKVVTTASTYNAGAIRMLNDANDVTSVFVSGNGKVQGAPPLSYMVGSPAIVTPGSVEVRDSAEVSAHGDSAIKLQGQKSMAVLLGGTLYNTAATSNYPVIKAEKTGSSVIVRGNTKVEARGNLGVAIEANGEVTVTNDAQVSATTGRAIRALNPEATVWVAGDALVQATAAGGQAISLKGDAALGGKSTVRATNGYAVYAEGAKSKIEINGATISAANTAADTGATIRATGVNSFIYIRDAQLSASSGKAILASGEGALVKIDNGQISATSNSAIHITGIRARTEIDGGVITASTINGTVRADGKDSSVSLGGKARLSGSSVVIDSYGLVSVAGDAEVSATSNNAILARGADACIAVSGGVVRTTNTAALRTDNSAAGIELSGGLVLAEQVTTAQVVSKAGGGVPSLIGDGLIVAWNKPAGTPNYLTFSRSNLTLQTAKDSLDAYWNVDASEKPGLTYINSTGERFVALSGLTVGKLVLTAADLRYTIPDNHSALDPHEPGIGPVVCADPQFSPQTGGFITVSYTGSGATTYAESETPPQAAGTYTVKAHISSGTRFAATTVTLGTYTILNERIKIVAVGPQRNLFQVGDSGSVTFDVVTTFFADGTYPVTLVGAPAGVSPAGSLSIEFGKGTLTLNISAAVTAGSYPIKAKVNAGSQSPESNEFSVEVSALLGVFDSGSGRVGDPYIITTPEQLLWLAQRVNEGNTFFTPRAYKLGADLDLSIYGNGASFNGGKGWITIGTSARPFTGTFDGDGHTISNLYINNSYDRSGLFGVLHGVAENIRLVDADLTGPSCVGGIAGEVRYGEVRYCSFSGSITATGSGISGGIVGYCRSLVTNCYSTGSVTGTDTYFGGIVGGAMSGSVAKCYSAMSVTGGGSVGGIAGNALRISDCYATGAISGIGDCVGGIVGEARESVTNCYATGKVNGISSISGIAGTSIAGVNITSCVALSPRVARNAFPSTQYRISTGLTSVVYTNNAAFAGMLNAEDNAAIWANMGKNNRDGTTIGATQIRSDGSLGGRFSGAVWTVVDGKLPILTELEEVFPGVQTGLIPAHIPATSPNLAGTPIVKGKAEYNALLSLANDYWGIRQLPYPGDVSADTYRSSPDVLGERTCQWMRDGVPIQISTDPVAYATGLSYQITEDDVGHSITAVVSTANCSGSVTSAPISIAPLAVTFAGIGGIPVPVAWQNMPTVITPTSQYIGTVSWSSAKSNPLGLFEPEEVYTATITLAPRPGYSLAALPADFFTVEGASSVTYAAGGNTVIATFPATGELSDADVVAKAKAAYTLLGWEFIKGFNFSMDMVIGNLSLPLGYESANILWTCENPALDATSGLVTRPSHFEGDAELILTATFTKGAAEDTLVFHLTVPATGHSFEDFWESDEDGHWHGCVCGRKADEATHTFGEWVIDSAASHAVAGSRHRDCTVCAFRQTEVISATGHSYGTSWEVDSDGHWHECECGTRSDEANHTFGEWYKDATDHWKVCSICSYEVKASHTYGLWVTDTEATHLVDGSRHRDCTECDYRQTGTIPAGGHSFTTTWESDADEHWHECICGDKNDVAPHEPSEWIIDLAATATTDGSKHKECTICGYPTDTEVIPATGESHIHDFGTEWFVDADGHWRVCSCGVRGDEGIHAYDPWQTDATDHWHVCSVCAYEVKDIHAFGTWVSDATEHKRTCSVCELAVTQVHTPGAWIIDTAPTATTEGSRHKACTICGHITETQVMPATGIPPSVVDTIEKINGLPDPDGVGDTDDGFVDKVVDATTSYEALTDEEKDLVPPDVRDKLAQAQLKAGVINHRSGDARATSDLAWYIRLVVTKTPASEAGYAAFRTKIGEKKLIMLYDIRLVNTLTRAVYELPVGQTLTIELVGLSLDGLSGIAVAHEKKDGAIEYLSAKVKGATLTFTTSSCSLFGVTATADNDQGNRPDNGQPGSSGSLPRMGDSSVGMLVVGSIGIAGWIIAAAGIHRKRE